MTADDPPRCPCGHEIPGHNRNGCVYVISDPVCFCPLTHRQAADAALVAAIKGGQGRNAAEVEQDGNGCFGLVVGALVVAFACFVAWVIYESVREAPPRHPPFSELPDDPAGGAK